MSLDDFGTGYSSLVHLRRLPVSELKIDRSFVARLAVDNEDAEIVRCTIDLAHSLGLIVVAEGVEDDETWERLRDLRCDAVQGWLVAAAMPPQETTAWLRARGEHGWRRPSELEARRAGGGGPSGAPIRAAALNPGPATAWERAAARKAVSSGVSRDRLIGVGAPFHLPRDAWHGRSPRCRTPTWLRHEGVRRLRSHAPDAVRPCSGRTWKAPPTSGRKPHTNP